MDLSEPFKFGILFGFLMVAVSMSRVGPEISRRMTNLGTMVVGVSLLGWAATSKPLAGGAWAGLGMMWTAFVVALAVGILVWGWSRRRRDRNIDAGVMPDDRDDPLSRVRRQRAAQQARARVHPRSAAAHRADGEAASTASAGRTRAMGWVALGIALMLVPLMFRSVREGTLDGSPGSLLALGCIVVGALLTVLGRSRWLHHTRLEKQALDSREHEPPR